MLKFLRRVFVILVLLFVIFVICRIVNPVGTANFVNKVRNIPQTISDFFHREKKEKNVLVEWISTVLSWDVKNWDDEIITQDEKNTVSVIEDNKDNNWEENVWWDSINDFVWLENLNKDTENLLSVDNKTTWTSEKTTWISEKTIESNTNTRCETDACRKIEQDLKNLAKEVEKLKTNLSWLNEKIESNTGNIVFVELKNEDTNTNPGNNTQSNTVQNNTPTTSQTTNKTTTTTTTTKKRTNCCDANCVLSQSECAEANMIWNLFK